MVRNRQSSWSRRKAVRVEVTIFREHTAFGETVHKPLYCYNMGSGREYTDITSLKNPQEKSLSRQKETDNFQLFQFQLLRL